jgi:hypothetical protein
MSGEAKRNIVIAIILISVTVSIYGFMVYRVFDQGSELSSQVQVLAEQQSQESSYLKLKRQSEETAVDRDELRSHFLLRESDSIDFLNLVEDLAPEAGVYLKTNNLEEVVSGEENWVQAEFSFSGTRENVQRFIEILETLPYVQKLTAIDLQSRAANDWQANVTMQVRVLAYDE